MPSWVLRGSPDDAGALPPEDVWDGLLVTVTVTLAAVEAGEAPLVAETMRHLAPSVTRLVMEAGQGDRLLRILAELSLHHVASLDEYFEYLELKVAGMFVKSQKKSMTEPRASIAVEISYGGWGCWDNISLATTRHSAYDDWRLLTFRAGGSSAARTSAFEATYNSVADILKGKTAMASDLM
jgi:hypothetical protein